MNATRIWREGLRRACRAPALVVMLWFCTLAVTVPPAIVLNNAIRAHLGASLEADLAADGVNYDWMQEFRAEGGPVNSSLRPDVIGFAAVMDNASAVADVSVRSAGEMIGALLFVALVVFLSPGAICRLAMDRPIGSGVMFGVCGRFLPRMTRFAALSFVFYGALFASIHPWLFEDLFDRISRDMTVERTAFFVRLALYAVFFLMVAGVNVLFDYARVRLIVEDRRSVVGAFSAAARFIRKNAQVALGAYVLNVISFVLILGAYALLAPGAGSAGWSAWSAFLIGQIYVLSRLAVKLAFWGSGVAAVQTRFGCPGFVRS